MNRDKTTKSTFTLDDLKKAKEQLDEITPEFNSPDLDDFISKGNLIENVILITPIPELKDIPRLRTKHGMLMVQYGPFVPQSFFMRKSPNFEYRGLKDG